MKKQGFTLIELIIVIAILAVLGLISIPLVNNYVSNAQNSKDLANCRVISNNIYHKSLLDEASSDIFDQVAAEADITFIDYYQMDTIVGFSYEVNDHYLVYQDGKCSISETKPIITGQLLDDYYDLFTKILAEKGISVGNRWVVGSNLRQELLSRNVIGNEIDYGTEKLYTQFDVKGYGRETLYYASKSNNMNQYNVDYVKYNGVWYQATTSFSLLGTTSLNNLYSSLNNYETNNSWTVVEDQDIFDYAFTKALNGE